MPGVCKTLLCCPLQKYFTTLHTTQSESLITRIPINGMEIAESQYQVQFVTPVRSTTVLYTIAIIFLRFLALMSKLPPTKKKKRKSHHLLLHLCETPSKSNQKWVLFFSQRKPLCSLIKIRLQDNAFHFPKKE